MAAPKTARLAIVLPRNMHFGPQRATSIDLCVRDFVRNTGFKAGLRIIGEAMAEPFADTPYHGIPGIRRRFGVLGFGEVRRAIAACRPDIVVVHQHLPSAARVARAFPDVPVLLHRHGPARTPHGLPALLDRARQRRLAAIIYVSADAARGHRAPPPALIVPNGIDTGTFTPGEKRKIVMFAGRGVREKGVVEFAETAAMTLAGRPDWRAVVAVGGGAPDEEAIARARAALAPAAGRVDWHADIPHGQVMKLWAEAAIGVVPSIRIEAFGRTAIEAMSCGAAVVASGVGGLTEVVGGAGIVTGSAAPEDLAAAVAGLMDDGERRRAFQEAGRRRVVEHYDIGRVTRLYDAAIEGVLAGRD